MKKITFLCLSVLILGISMVISMPNANAQEKKADNAPDYRLISMAMDLADYGYDNQSAMALAQAAEILADNPVKSANAKDVETKKTLGAVPGAHDYSPNALLAEAKRVAGKDNAVLAYIEKVEKTVNAPAATRGTSKAAAYYQDVYISGGSTKFFYIDIPAASYIEVETDGSDERLCLYVYNEIGELKDSDCRTNPSTSAPFLFSQEIQIKLVNMSSYGTYCRVWVDGISL